ncbi:hypothetical protein [Roseisalinus antarcticus]|uniref:hypothetical protein n=1 Tax=Roseisalinus antarcticus TaxID=254357 RepID=UPI0013564C25|nr:hypothetical protein [Roseisalinus antarcticus]
MIRYAFLAAATVFLGAPAFADCPSAPPFSPSLASGDATVDAAWLSQTLVGMRLVFDDGTEVYREDGSYSYVAGNQQWDASSYRFYENGFRCIGYGQPRFDYYVVNDGNLILVNSQGSRFAGQLTN